MLSLTRARSVTTEELERVCGSRLTESRFAALCNAVALTTRDAQPASAVSFSQHLMYRQDGIDPDWQIELFDDRHRILPHLKPGLNAVECRCMPCRGQANGVEFVELLARVQGAVSAIERRSNSQPDRYILATNLRLGPPLGKVRRLLERNLLLGHDRARKTDLRLLGAEELTEAVNRAPYLQSVFLENVGFQLWPDAWRSHSRARLFGNHVDFVGREAELAQLRHLLNDPTTRVITLSGPALCGKTRLALEATAPWQYETIVVNAAQLESPSRLLRLAAPGKRVNVLVDECDFETASQVIPSLSRQSQLKTVVVLSSGVRLSSTFGDYQGAVNNIVLAPLSATESHELLSRAVSSLDHETESWIAREADGNPGILLAAARLRNLLHRRAPSLQDAMAQGMKQRIRDEFGEQGYRMLRILSMLTRVDTLSKEANEVEEICRVLDPDLKPTTILRALPRFENAGIVHHAGRYLEVVPSILAEELTLDALRVNPENAGPLVRAFGRSGRLRIAGRHQYLPTVEDESGRWPEALPSILSRQLQRQS